MFALRALLVKSSVGYVETGRSRVELVKIQPPMGSEAAKTGTLLAETGTLFGKTGTFLGETGTILGKSGTLLDETGTILGKTGTLLGETGILLGKTGTLFGETGTGCGVDGTRSWVAAPSVRRPLSAPPLLYGITLGYRCRRLVVVG